MQARRPLATLDLACYALLLGTFTTCVWYRYGVDNHVSELPLVLRAIDPGYLPNDFYTNAASAFGPRSNFTRAIAALATREGLPFVYFGLALACNAAIAFVTALTGRYLFGGRAGAGVAAAALVLCVAPFRLGYTGEIFVSQLLASRVVVPLLLLALFAALRQRALLCAASAGAAAWLHPSFGLEGGVLALLVLALAGDPPPVRRLGAAALVFAACAAAVLAPYLAQPAPDAATFLAIETRFRHPHHNLPSRFASGDWVRALAFLAAAGLAFDTWRQLPGTPRRTPRALLALGLALLLACLAGYVFVELVPSALVAVARPFRLLLLLKWLGLLLIGGVVGAAACARPRSLLGAPGIALAIVVALALAGPDRRGSLLGLLAFGLAGLALAWIPRAWVARAVCAVAAAGLLAQVCWGPPPLPQPLARAAARLRPALALTGRASPELEVARWARANTPPDAIFLVPPDLGEFRLLAERAIVVDFKAFPFQEAAMREWRERLATCYGETQRTGWDALAELSAHYRDVDAATLARVRERYGARYAVVPRGAANAAPVVYENTRFKVLALGPTPSPRGPAQSSPPST